MTYPEPYPTPTPTPTPGQVRLSSMMLLDVFWRATLGEKVLVFQPELPLGLGLGVNSVRVTPPLTPNPGAFRVPW